MRGNPACCRHRSPGAAETGRWEDKEKGQVTSQPLSQLCRRNSGHTRLITLTIMAQSDGAEQAMDVNIQGAAQSEREEIGSSGPTGSPNAGPLGSMKEAVSRSSPTALQS